MRYTIAFLVLLSQAVFASNVEVYRFDKPEQEKTYKALTEELRCLVCQNQNIADSNAELAQDMRRKTYELVSQGKSKQEVADYMAERYGDFVLYKPPFKASTAVLWIGPFALLLLGLWLLARTVRARQQTAMDNNLSDAQLQEAADLLNSSDKPS
jgi:cytochrome c-type biogenesis protein CcmH